MSSIVGTEIPSANASSAYHSAGMSDLAIYRQLTGEQESRVCPKHSDVAYKPVFRELRDASCPRSRPSAYVSNCELLTIQNLSMTKCAFLGIHAQFVATLLY
jgi:hypothetical protein